MREQLTQKFVIMNNTEVLKKFNEQFLEALKEAQASDFSYSWIPASVPNNGITGRSYNFLNQFFLNFKFAKYHYKNNKWLTFKQISKFGGKVMKGEHGTMIVFSKKSYLFNGTYYESYKDIPFLNEEEESTIKEKFLLRYYLVWNTSQTENLPETYYENDIPKNVFETTQVDEFLKATGAEIKYDAYNKNFYTPSGDYINLVRKEQFKSLKGYYGTVLHELSHWSGHKTRLNRFEDNKWLETTNKKYAFEELVAEISSAYLCRYFDIDKPIKHSAAYVNSWLTGLNKDQYFVYRAFAKSEQAFNYLLKTARENGFSAIPGKEVVAA